MKKIILAFCLTAFASLAAFAQNTDEYKKGEFYIGYSNGQVDTGIDTEDDNEFEEFFNERETFHGFEAAGVYNVSRYVGIKGDVSGTYNKQDFSVSVPVGGGTSTFSAETRSSLYNFLGGVQFKDNATEGRFKPFAHALVGAGHARVKINNVVCPVGVDCTDLEGEESETGFAGAFGGGLDIKINNRVDFRAVQVDYNPVKFDNGVQHNLRFGIGFVFK
jgi:opacity protein-like surface antigen